MYKVGSYTYNSREAYERLLVLIMGIFVMLLFLLIIIRKNIPLTFFVIAFVIDSLTVVHLWFRYASSRRWVKHYWFKNY